MIEAAVLDFVAHRAKAARDARDREIIDRNAKKLNEAADDTLDYQAKW